MTSTRTLTVVLDSEDDAGLLIAAIGQMPGVTRVEPGSSYEQARNDILQRMQTLLEKRNA